MALEQERSEAADDVEAEAANGVEKRLAEQ
jgi:hypothetical protein